MTPVYQPSNSKAALHLYISCACLLIFFSVFVWIAIASERHAKRLEVHEQGKQLALSLEDAIDVVRSHVFSARRTMEHALVRAENASLPDREMIVAESGALHLDPKAEFQQASYKRNVAAASSILPGVAAAHQWHSIFQWTYFYDAKARWFLIYPYLSQNELFRSTKTGDLSAAIRVALAADGTQPIDRVSPRSNPTRDMHWTSPYEDAVGKGRMVTLLTPVYLADEFVGAIGSDVTLKHLDAVLENHAPDVARSLLVNAQGTVLAESANFGPDIAQPIQDDPAWQRLPLRGTDWTLWIHSPDSALNRVVVQKLLPSFVVGGLLLTALFLAFWFRQQRGKALTATVESLEETRTALARADRLGALGGMIAGVSREIDAPLQHAAHSVGELQAALGAFRELQQRGLRRSELDEFVSRIGHSNTQLAHQLAEANDLLQRFRQMAVDQSSEQAQPCHLRDTADNVAAMLRPALKRRGCVIDNAIAADLTVTTDAGAISQLLHYLLSDALERSQSGQVLRLTAGWNTSRNCESIELALFEASGTPPNMAADHLLLAKRLSNELGGELNVEHSDAGNRITLLVPVKS